MCHHTLFGGLRRGERYIFTQSILYYSMIKVIFRLHLKNEFCTIKINQS
jgi:hypothetical protein